ncbi:dipeptide epimerase [Pigmentiphaga soli]|uniref:Dipeptide epimerase n=1 Tax=Pigmentiphaga soli TaxID=1007095 RepID=A0ABP8HAB1_9BURK
MKITEVLIRPMRIPRKESFAVRTGAYDFLPNTHVEIRTDEGLVGHGEGAPIVDYFGEGQESMVETMKRYLAPALLGKDPLNIRERIRDMDAAIPRNPCAKAALDIALHDIKGKAFGASIGSLLGGASSREVPITVSIGLAESEKMKAKAVEAAEQGFTVLKLKGGQSVVEDLTHLSVVREAVGERGPWLRLDANAGYVNRGEIYRYLDELRALRLILLEQPYPSQEWEALRSLRDQLRIPILLDESMQTPWDFQQLVKSPEGFVANLKVQICGGLYKASQLVAACERFQIPVMIGSQRESAIGNTASLHLASLITRMDYTCDQRYANAVPESAEVVVDGPSLARPMVTVPTGPGLGVTVDWKRGEANALATLSVR